MIQLLIWRITSGRLPGPKIWHLVDLVRENCGVYQHAVKLIAEVSYFGDGHEMIKMSMKQGETTIENLSIMERELRSHRDHDAAKRIVGNSVCFSASCCGLTVHVTFTCRTPAPR